MKTNRTTCTRARILATLALTLIWGFTPARAKDAMCIPETALGFGEMLDRAWVDAQAAAGRTTTEARPTFCFGWEPRVVATSHGPSRLLGTYDSRTNRADVSLTMEELAVDGACVIRHEMLHALLGSDEAAVRAAQGCTVAVGGGL